MVAQLLLQNIKLFMIHCIVKIHVRYSRGCAVVAIKHQMVHYCSNQFKRIRDVHLVLRLSKSLHLKTNSGINTLVIKQSFYFHLTQLLFLLLLLVPRNFKYIDLFQFIDKHVFINLHEIFSEHNFKDKKS